MNLINRRGRMQGFLSLDIVPRYGEIAMQLGHLGGRRQADVA